MPGLDGIEALGRIRAVFPGVPAVFLTAKDAVEHRIRGLAAGGDDYVTKPFSMEELILRLHRLIERSGAVAASGSELVVGDLVLNTDTMWKSPATAPTSGSAPRSSSCCAT